MTGSRKRRMAVVAGAGSGIGRAASIRLAADHESVVLVGRRAERLGETARMVGQAHPTVSTTMVSADLRDPHDADAVRRAVVDASAPESPPVVDTVVNAVGGYHRPTDDSLPGVAALWAADWTLNVLTTVLLVEAVKPLLSARSGRVVAVSSVAAMTGVGGPYSSAKSGLHGWARAAARELAPRGITVNVVAPGYVRDTNFFGRALSVRRHEQLSAQALTGRATTPEQVAETIAWLAQDASGQVTGQVVAIDGGHTLTVPRGPE